MPTIGGEALSRIKKMKTLSVLSFILTLLAYVPLWARIYRDHHRKPLAERMKLPKGSWLVLSFVDLGFLISAEGAFWMLALANLLGSGTVTIYALLEGERGWHGGDKLTLAFALPALIAWFYLRPSVLAIVLLVVAVSVGAYEICKELCKRPKSYGVFAWWLFWLGGMANVASLASWSDRGAIAPWSFFLIQAVMVALSLRRERLPPVAASQFCCAA